MREAPDRLSAIYAEHGEKLRFLIVGVWNTAFGLVVLWVLERLMPHDSASVAQKQAILVANWLIAVTHNFFTFKLLVFRTRGDWLREYRRMYVTYAGTFVVQSVLIQSISARFGLSLFWANVPSIVVVTILSYVGHRYFTFRGRHLIEAFDAHDVFDRNGRTK